MLLSASSVLRQSSSVSCCYKIKQSGLKPNLICLLRFLSTDQTLVTLKDVVKVVKPAKNPEYVPRSYLKEPSQEILRHLRWMLQKDILGQDMFLMGAPGQRRRNLALAYLELIEREVEFIALSRDTTEADLKQRKEIENGTANYHDQSAVRAAINGRILILEGIEKAERNVLPILNNLLENREMHLEDGRFLIPASRYDKLLKEHSQKELDFWRLVRVSEDFRVIALGLPAPRYSGHPLDPPLRSRFQARHISSPSFEEQLEEMKKLTPNVDPGKLSQFLSCCHALATEEAQNLGLPDFPLDNVTSAAFILETFPNTSVYNVFYRYYPYKLFLTKEGKTAVEDILETFGVLDKKALKEETSNVKDVKLLDSKAEVIINANGDETIVNVPAGSGKCKNPIDEWFVDTNYQNSLIANMMKTHLTLDWCLVGPKGCGKSATVRKLANLLGYQIEPIVLYQDMTSRDLIQQRTTLMNGDTVWKNSALITAALEGKLAVLDGIHRLHPSTLAVIYRLVQNRELQMHDGKRLMAAEHYDVIKEKFQKTDDEMNSSGIWKIHPAFRIISLAEPPMLNSSVGQWLNSELLSLFLFHEMRPLDKTEEIHVIRSKYGEPSKDLLKIIELAHVLRSSTDPTLQSIANSLSTRQLFRIAGKMNKFPNSDAYDIVQRACLARFLPILTKQALENCLKKLDILPKGKDFDMKIICKVDEEFVTIGETRMKRYETNALTKIPDILFYNVPQHLTLLENLLQDFSLGENLLLVGNQGVGKNKIADRLLQLMNRPREYIQLHRDTTVQTLTIQPMVKDGVVVYEDSPLVQAVKFGHVLVIDEADKAPTHVTCILKTLVESGEMILSDGRRIVPSENSSVEIEDASDLIAMHPDFRMIVLANRPGFPFLGNDFFGSLGDLFSTHSVDNPTVENEIQLLKQYGPDVDDKIIYKLVKAFGELRSMADQGLVSYPYSTREVVNIVKHLQKFPKESLNSVVQNVFDFDRYSPEVFDTLISVLHKHGIPIGTSSKNVELAKEIPLPNVEFYGTWSMSNKERTINVHERFVKLKTIANQKKLLHILDKVEARSAWFTEMLSYWTIPINNTGIVSALAVTKGFNKSGVDDKFHVLTTNPLSIFTMTRESEHIQEIPLQGLITPTIGNKPLYTIAPDKSGNLIIHEATSNTILSVNLEQGCVNNLQLSSFMDMASDKFSQTFRNKDVIWKMKTDFLISDDLLILFTPYDNQIEIVNLQKMAVYSMNLPFRIESILPALENRWLIQSNSNKIYTLVKSSATNPCPNVLKSIEIAAVNGDKLGDLVSCGKDNLREDILSNALKKNINSPNRLLADDKNFATIIVGFPELDGENDVFFWPRKEKRKISCQPIITDNGQIVRTISPNLVPRGIFPDDKKPLEVSAYFEIVDTCNHKVRYLPIPQPVNVSPVTQWLYTQELPLYSALTSNEGVVTVDAGGCVRLWETSLINIEKSLGEWRKMVGADGQRLQLTKERYSGLDVSGPKHGKIDHNDEPHVGGNTWAGGTGGRDTAGLGGKGGPYRLDAGHTVHQLSDEEKNNVPEHIKKAAREMGLKAFKQRLKDIRMSEYDHKLYSQYSDAVRKEVQALRVILGSLQAKSHERQWWRHQTSGELDDTKLIEGLTGEKNIYRRRAEKEPEIGAPQLKPKRLKLVVDVSGSMYRFNGYDGRLDREMEACVMVIEAFNGYEEKLKYDIVGHSGEDCNIVFVDHSQPPADNKRTLEVIKTMHAHSQFCMSGDNTLEATQHAIASLAKEDSDESIVVVLSDANLERYGIPAERFVKVLSSNSNVSAYAIFIGSLGNQAERLMTKMPPGKAFVCMDLKNIPRILQQIFTASVLSTSKSN